MQYIQIWRSWSLSLPSTRLPCLFSGGEGPRGGKVLGILHSVAQMARVLSVIYGVWCCGGLRLRQCFEAPARVSTQQHLTTHHTLSTRTHPRHSSHYPLLPSPPSPFPFCSPLFPLPQSHSLHLFVCLYSLCFPPCLFLLLLINRSCND